MYKDKPPNKETRGLGCWLTLMVITLLINYGLEGEAEFGDFATVTGSGSSEDLVSEAEVAVLFAPFSGLRAVRKWSVDKPVFDGLLEVF